MSLQAEHEMQKIGIDTVCRQIYRRNTEVLDSAASKDIQMLPYDFDEFEADAMAEGFIVSRATVLAKWKMLKASGVVVEKASRTFVDVAEVRHRCERRQCA